MRRRELISGALRVGAGALAFGVGGRALAQAGPGRRPDWSPTGPLEGREPEDPRNLDPEERRHAPVLVLPERVRPGRPFDLVVQVGPSPHVMTEDHHIDWVEVAVDEARVFVADLTPSVAYPIVRVPVVLRAPADVTARAHCNLHGTWRTRRRVEVG
ncbi:MAG TPA: desulfoferrodoxin family protein [Sandaracinaceae bacterium LLY-WYZ-13_1]|nr:desulfoferrodoxin family protein [Sandaracinaceae bacterium LLY-WYZ-13_1]